MRRHLFTPLAALAVLSIMVAACGGSATAAPSAAAPSAAASVAPSVEPSPSPEASASPAASAAADASGALPSIALPSFNADKDLEALLPSTFGGATLQKFSMKGAQFLGSSPDPAFDQAIAALGLTAADVSVAIAADPTGTMEISFAAIRFAGADSGKLLQVFQAASQATGDLVGSVNVGGKDVIKTKDSSGSFSYFHVKNDTVLGVTAKSDAAAAPALQVLP
jgi:hypothetical protein